MGTHYFQVLHNIVGLNSCLGLSPSIFFNYYYYYYFFFFFVRRLLVGWTVFESNNFTMIAHVTKNAHVTKTCKAGFFYLHNICRIRKFLTQEITEKLILLYGLPSNLLAKLQRVQNAAARLIHRAPSFCHITPLLVDLHWLDIKSRIDFKIILLTFKAIHGQAPAYICELVNLKPNSSYGLTSNIIT